MSVAGTPPTAASSARRTLSVRAVTPTTGSQHFFSPCPRGLEAVLVEELVGLGAEGVKAVPGGVGYRGPYALGMRVCLWSRVASRVLWRLAEAEYRHEEDVYRLARSIDWPHLFSVRETIRVQVDALRSPVRSLEFVTLRVKDAVVDRFRAAMGSRPNVETSHPDMRIHVFLTAYKATIYLDLAGEALFKRGYRQHALAAPLRENLAAGMLLLKAWRGDRPLLDPMMGSGTILCEAAMIATHRAPGRGRRFAFEKLRHHDDAHWQRMLGEAGQGERPLAEGLLWGADRDAVAVTATAAHLRELGGEAWLKVVGLQAIPVENLDAPASSGLLLSNPPYGARLEALEGLRAWYPLLGAWMKRSLPGWTACFITADTSFPGGVGFKPKRKTPLFNGALECRLYEFEMYPGSQRTAASS